MATRQSLLLAEIVDELPLVPDRAMCSADVEDKILVVANYMGLGSELIISVDPRPILIQNAIDRLFFFGEPILNFIANCPSLGRA